MFDLEKAIAAWRRSLTFNRTFQSEDVDELERHLRDQVRDLTDGGMSEEEAFRTAREQFGQYGDVEKEYRKVRWESISARGRTMEELGARGAMLVNYFRVAFRSFRRHPLYFGLNLGGLAIGMAAALLIMLFIKHEHSYDAFHDDADRLYRVVSDMGTTSGSAMLAPTLAADFNEIESFTRISERWFEVRVTQDDIVGMEDDFFFVDSTFFDVFSYPLLSGNPDNVLDTPFSVVITESAAARYFGSEDPVGQTLQIQGLGTDYDFTVTGVAADMRGDSHFQFDLVASFSSRYRTKERHSSIDSWMHSGERTYIKLAPGALLETVKAGMLEFARRHRPDAVERLGEAAGSVYAFQPIRDIHLHSHLDNEFGPNGNPQTLNIFGWVALLIVLIAWLNYVNMSTARYAARATEVGVRKVVGANRVQLAGQFLVETGLIMLFGIGLAVMVAWMALPAFGQIVGRILDPVRLLDGSFIVMAVGLVVVSILLAGTYPAVFLSRVRPAQGVKGLTGNRATNSWLRKGLVFTQFALSVLLVFGTGIMYQQLEYLQQKRLGMNPDQVVIIENDGGLSSSTDDTFKSRLLEHSGVVSVSAISSDFPLEADQTRMLMEKRPTQFPIPEEDLAKRPFHTTTDARFLETMEISLLEGRDFQDGEEQFDRDLELLPTIINQRAVEVLGWDDPIGRTFECCFTPTPVVVGVMEDFHFESAKKEVAPLAISPSWHSRRILVRIHASQTREALAHIEASWKELAPGWPVQWSFMNDRFAAAYTAEQRLASSFQLFAILAVIIACLGLFGLSTLMVHNRVREIGIRKVVGASAQRVVGLLMGDLLRPILLALLVAMPLAWWLAGRWLQDFPYRIDLGVAPFAQTAFLTLLVAVLTISWHTWRAAHINPADAIRYE